MWRTVRYSTNPHPAKLLTPSIKLWRASLRTDMRSMVVKTERGRAHLFTLGERAGKACAESRKNFGEEMEAEEHWAKDINGQRKGVMHSGNWSHSFSREHWECSVRRTCRQSGDGQRPSQEKACAPCKRVNFSQRRLNQGLSGCDWEVFLAAVCGYRLKK